MDSAAREECKKARRSGPEMNAACSAGCLLPKTKVEVLVIIRMGDLVG